MKRHIKQVSEIGKKIRSEGKSKQRRRVDGDGLVDFRNQVLISHTARNRVLLSQKKTNAMKKTCKGVFGRLGGIVGALG